ncbi:MAG: gamma-glutamyltransferase [Rhodospirillales bacterium]|nr:gamma-glutamyltransferase [Rhodospirillales bacterium]MBO6785942.1 gamma-glutamyltransferase [Rhodospirillales bacterium]
MTFDQTFKAGVAAGHRETANAALAVLRDGGNAFDAAIAGFLAACVAEPVLSSLGGGGFLVAKTAAGDIDVFDFFTETPLKRPDRDAVEFTPIHADFGTTVQEFHIGMGAVATPGAVAGIFDVHAALGRMPMTELVQPAATLARNGMILNPFQAYLLSVVGPIYGASASSRALFCRDGGDTLLQAGDLYHPEAFAGFLEALAREGADLFYKGEVAAEIAAMGGVTIGRDDLERYRVERRTPLRTRIAAHDVFMNPPPAIGGALIGYMLRTLGSSDLQPADAGRARHVRALVAAMDACNDARRNSRIDVSPLEGAAMLTGAHPPAYRGTTHISVADAEGNLAALTVSNGEGCGHIVPDTGVMLNNMLGEDDLNAAGFFNWPEGVRLSSMMTPGMLAGPDGEWTAFGSGGSNRIRTALTQVILNVCLFGLPVDDAVTAPRLHLDGGKLSVEPGLHADADIWPGEIQAWPERNMFFGGAHVIRRDAGGRITGAGDPRRDGVFAGF